MLNPDGFSVLSGRHTFVLFKNLGKITAFSKAAVQTHIGDRHIGAVQQIGGLLRPVKVHVVHRGLVGDGAEYPAEVFGIHAGHMGQLFQG